MIMFAIIIFRQPACKSYNDVETEEDTAHTKLPFTPRCKPGPQLGLLTQIGGEYYTCAVDFCAFFLHGHSYNNMQQYKCLWLASYHGENYQQKWKSWLG